MSFLNIKPLRRITWVLVSLGCALAIFYFFALWSMRPWIVELPYPDEKPLNEESALQLGFEALSKIGLKSMEPRPYWENEPDRFFAQNREDPRNGYIIFQEREKGVARRRSYTVQLEKADHKVIAKVGENL